MLKSRRSYLKHSAALVGALVAKSALGADAQCGLTPAQVEGPFYPIQDQFDKDNDLTCVHGQTRSAKGEIVYIRGVVRDENCELVPGAMVEIWQACATGKYNHPGDPNPQELDPYFQYWGRAMTNAAGEYRFKTIIPGAYSATDSWIRPPHIHMKVHKRAYHELTTQLYFKGHHLNRSDRILQALTPSEQKKVTVEYDKAGEGRFDIVLSRI